jgi:hypothetical protein
MMGGWNKGASTPADISAAMPLSQEDAFSIAQAYLDQYFPGAVVAEDSTQFYGYCSMDFEKNGIVAGMLSVNGFSREVFLHNWHGKFIEESGRNKTSSFTLHSHTEFSFQSEIIQSILKSI